jgi:hypothetical protein
MPVAAIWSDHDERCLTSSARFEGLIDCRPRLPAVRPFDFNQVAVRSADDVSAAALATTARERARCRVSIGSEQIDYFQFAARTFVSL